MKKKLSLISFGDEFEDEENNAAMSGACAIGMQSIYDTFQSKSKSKHEVKPKSKPTVETKKRKEPSDGGSELKAMTKMPKRRKRRRRKGAKSHKNDDHDGAVEYVQSELEEEECVERYHDLKTVFQNNFYSRAGVFIF